MATMSKGGAILKPDPSDYVRGNKDPEYLQDLRDWKPVLPRGTPIPEYSNRPVTGGSAQPTTPTDTTKEEAVRSARGNIALALTEIGLESELDWAYGQLLAGFSPGEIMLQLRQRDAYKQRFVLNTYRKQAGLNEWSPATIIAYENELRQTFRSWGIPLELYDTTEELARFGGKDLSVVEINRRIERGFNKVVANPDARSWFRDQYGADGDVALAMFFFDHERSLQLLEQQAGAGTLGGTGRRYGINLSRERAERLVQNGVNVDLAPGAFARLGQLDPLFRETISETEDLTAEEIGVDYVFDQSRTAEAILSRRAESRAADFGGRGGTFAQGRERTGLASAR